MRQSWTKEELVEHWSLLPDERRLLHDKMGKHQLVFAIMLKFFQYAGRFPEDLAEFPKAVVNYLVANLSLSAKSIDGYSLDGRVARDHRLIIRNFLNFRTADYNDAEQIEKWLIDNILSQENSFPAIENKVYEHYRELKIVPPSKSQIKQCIDKAISAFEQNLFSQIAAKLSKSTKQRIDELIYTPREKHKKSDPKYSKVSLNYLKQDPRQASIDTVLNEIAKLKRIRYLELPAGLFQNISSKVLLTYRVRIIMETPAQISDHPANSKYAMIAAFCYLKEQAIIDSLVDLLIQITNKIATKAEKHLVKELLRDLRKVTGKNSILYRMAIEATEHPKGIIDQVLYPAVGEQTLLDLVKEFKSTGIAYQREVHTTMRASYGNHYRRMLTPILNELKFCTTDEVQNPIIKALNLLRKYSDSKLVYYPTKEEVPVESIVQGNVYDIVVEKTEDGQQKINRINYEVEVLQTLRDKMRCKEIWVANAYRHRNPDEDLPQDFYEKKDDYFQLLKQPSSAEEFIIKIQQVLRESLAMLNKGMPKNKKVKIILKKRKGKQKGWVSLTPLTAQADPVNIEKLKAEVMQQWPMTSLLDVLKEADMLVDITSHFKSMATREILDKDTLQKRLLLCLFGIGTNTGLKRISSGNPGTSYEDLRYISKRFVNKDYLRQAIIKIVNAIFAARDTAVWGEATVACASDSKKFGAWDQNLLTEWHVRYGGRGIMIYWHVDKKSVCIYSQLKSCSSSEVASMIEGVLRHCTDMNVEKNYVDSHGQSEVAFAFSYMLNFQLLPRLKDIGSQKLCRCYDTDTYQNLQEILTRSINWELIREQYIQMIRYTAALRLGTADAEAILKRFNRHNRQHPTYKALAELGKAIKTIFLCRYLQHEELRQEIHEGLNVVERWNGVNSFIFYGKGGEISTNSRDDQELAVLCLHLLQICLVYINTLMIQQVLAQEHWKKRLTLEDKRALTPLIHLHINPYGLFLLDMKKRLPLQTTMKMAA
ncbi:MAG: Tn3 family transposase [bacterium]